MTKWNTITDTKEIAAALSRAADVGDIPGVVAAAAASEGPIFEGGFGKRDLATGAPMTVDTVVGIASMTKAVTGACAMQLVERGKLSLDAPIKSVLPELAAPKVLQGFDAAGNPKLWTISSSRVRSWAAAPSTVYACLGARPSS